VASRLIAKPLQLEEIAVYYKDSEAALRIYFFQKNRLINPSYKKRFSDYNADEIVAELNSRIDELGRSTSLSLLATLEAVFRIDYKERVRKRKKDCLSKALKKIYRAKETRASLEEDILELSFQNILINQHVKILW
jgi:hypothetical protein